MDKIAKGGFSADLSLKLIAAIQDQSKWGEVLDLILETTSAKAAIITLRDKKTCQIVNDVAIEEKFHSPLIRGFSQDAIVHYLTNLRTIDPWAAAQIVHYPHLPLQMSKVCPPETIKNKAFLTWLEGEGFNDTIVFELDRMSGYWTAINLFVDDATGPQAAELYEFAQQNFDLLRTSWKASQQMSRYRQTNKAILNEASSGGAPVCLAGANGELIECNDLFRELLTADAIRLSASTQKLSFGRPVDIQGLDSWEQHALARHDTDTMPFLILATPVDPDPLFVNKRERLWLLTCTNYNAAATPSYVTSSFNLNVLTSQERKLYTAVVNGCSIAKAGDQIGLKRSRSFDVWSSIKDKLGITSAHSLR